MKLYYPVTIHKLYEMEWGWKMRRMSWVEYSIPPTMPNVKYIHPPTTLGVQHN